LCSPPSWLAGVPQLYFTPSSGAWYPDAYNSGWVSLLLPHTGYLQTISRLGGLLAQPFPLTWAPTLFAGIALAIQTLPPVFLVSSRMQDAWPQVWGRLAFALLYIGLPYSYEVFVNLTNAQWHLAVLAFLVVVSRPPAGGSGRVFDCAVLLLSGLSGPFCLLLLPVAVWQFAETRSPTARWRLGLPVAAGVVQVVCLMTTINTRAPAPLGAGPRRLARIVALNIVLSVLLGQHNLPRIMDSHVWQPSNLLPIAVTMVGLVACVFAWRSRPGLLRKTCVLAAALVHPQVSLTEAQWMVMTFPGFGDRYYIFPMLAWIGVLFALVGSNRRALRLTSAGLFALMVVELPGDWEYPGMPPTDFLQTAREFEAAAPGTPMKFSVNPGNNVMSLTKRP
jgi:hypothetical protein